MIREGSTRDSFTGKAGQMAVLAELLARQCNVAVPEVDEGEDVLAFILDDPDVTRVQVKTANAERLKEAGRYAARVSVPLAQLHARTRMDLYYVLAIRLEDRWVDFILISRTNLYRASARGLGYVNRNAGELQLYLSFAPDEVICSGQSWQAARNAWTVLPVMARSTQS
jgi:hypothetical protein